jgi:hypothetical protein
VLSLAVQGFVFVGMQMGGTVIILVITYARYAHACRAEGCTCKANGLNCRCEPHRSADKPGSLASDEVADGQSDLW